MRTQFGIEDLKKHLNTYKFYDDFYFLTHPDNLKLLEKSVKKEKVQESNQFFAGYFYNPVRDGIEIRTDINMPRFAQKWEFPQVPFTDFDETIDGPWAQAVGFGKWIDTKEPLFYKINKMSFFSYNSHYSWKPMFLLS